ncbi:hypothetical protein QVA66_05550 [Staphylococcus chromogenes]|nr:hypothetical protein [Staphylococcus chromogenes]
MKDPTRIPQVIAELEQLWAALPNHSFGDLISLIGAEFFGDDELPARLAELRRQYPVSVRDCAGPCLVATGSHLISLLGTTVVVRRHGQPPGRPATWECTAVVSGAVGTMLRLIDAHEQPRTYGLIESIRPLDAAPIPERLGRKTIGDAVYLIDVAEDCRVILARSLWLFEQRRREVATHKHAWHEVHGLRPGENCGVTLPDGRGELELGVVHRVLKIS